MTAASSRPGLHTRAFGIATFALAGLAAAAAGLPAGCGGSGDKPAAPARAGKAAKPPPVKAREEPEGPGSAVGGYLEALVKSKKQAETVAGRVQMRSLWQALEMHALAHEGKFPTELKDLGDPVLVRAPGADGRPYRYLPGQTDSMNASNVLVHEETPAHGGKVMVLRLGGQVDLLTPEQLQQALARTRKGLAPRRRRSRQCVPLPRPGTKGLESGVAFRHTACRRQPGICGFLMSRSRWT